MNDIIMHINYGEVKILHYGKKTIDDKCWKGQIKWS